MAFMGIMIVGAILLIILGIVIFTIATLVIGLVNKKKHKVLSKVMLILSGIGALCLAGILLFIFIPRPEIIETPNGEVKVKKSIIEDYKVCLENRDLVELKELLDEQPALVFYRDANRVTMIDYGMYNTDVELMQLAWDYGAIFDNPITYNHLVFDNSAHSFFVRLDYPDVKKEVLHEKGVTTEDIIATVEFMIEHGAELTYSQDTNGHTGNFYNDALWWVMLDGVQSDLDDELLELIEEGMKGKK